MWGGVVEVRKENLRDKDFMVKVLLPNSIIKFLLKYLENRDIQGCLLLENSFIYLYIYFHQLGPTGPSWS